MSLTPAHPIFVEPYYNFLNHATSILNIYIYIGDRFLRWCPSQIPDRTTPSTGVIAPIKGSIIPYKLNHRNTHLMKKCYCKCTSICLFEYTQEVQKPNNTTLGSSESYTQHPKAILCLVLGFQVTTICGMYYTSTNSSNIGSTDDIWQVSVSYLELKALSK